MPKHLGAILTTLFLLQQVGAAQIASLKDSTLSINARPIVDFFNRSLSQSYHLYNGRAHHRHPPGIKSHGYYNENDWQVATITYDGMTFAGVQALYDMVHDELVIRHFDSTNHIQLVKDKVTQFIISNQTFIQVVTDSTGVLQPGFYEQLHTGKTSVLVRRIKNIEERVTPEQVERRYVQKNRYFIGKNNRYFPIRNEKDLLLAFSDHKKAVQQFLRKNKLRYRKDPDNTLIKTTEYYDSLNN